MKYTIKKLASSAGVSVRTLHHYDDIGLLRPAEVGDNGYRYYGESELLRLQQILFFRELEFPLEKIKLALDSPNFNNLEALRSHRQVLLKQKHRLSGLIKTIDHTITNLKKGVSMTTNDLYGGFTKQQMEEYQAEAEARWGHTEAYQQSVQRTKNWTKAQYQRVFDESRDIVLRLAKVMDKPVHDESVQSLVKEHRANINRFYDVSDEIYRGLAQMYVADPRFAKHYDDVKPGLAKFLSAAMIASLNQI
jgi:DNA-binding transcriptional MerR regulator